MSLMPAPDLKQELDQFVALFAPLYTAWRNKQPDAATLPETANDCLAADVMRMGVAFIGLDNVSKKLESNLVAEMIACLDTKLDHMPYEYEIGMLDGRVSEQALEANGQMPELLSIRVLRDWVTLHPGARTAVQTVLDIWGKLAARVVARDGRIDSKEIEYLKRFEAHIALG